MTKSFYLFSFFSLILFFSSCEKSVSGCTDSNANNFNSEATEDDGSCTFDIADSYVGFWDVEEIRTVSGMSITFNYDISITKLGANTVEITNFVECVPLEATVSETSLILTNLQDLPFGDCFIGSENFERSGDEINYTLNTEDAGVFVQVAGTATKQ